jgi:AcrR family transcriptional regulator
MSSRIFAVTGTRVRLATHERREQLLRIGAELFAARPYDDVWIEEVAELAAVSRGLLYHYFATKREFFAAVVRAEADRILKMTETDPQLSVPDQVTAGLAAYFDYVEHYTAGYRLLHRAAVSADHDIRAIVEGSFAEQERRVLGRLRVADRHADIVRLLVRGWLAFVVAVCLDWLEHPSVSREQLRDLCADTLLVALDGKLVH